MLIPKGGPSPMRDSALLALGVVLITVTAPLDHARGDGGPSSATAAKAAAFDIGQRKQLFIDRRFIGRSENVTLRTNAAEKLGLIRDENDRPLEWFDHISRVIEDGGKIKMYLGANSVAVAESEDGIHFRRTGVTIPGGIFTTIFLDPHDAAERRYKVFWIQGLGPEHKDTDGIYAGYSADGVHFTTAGRVLPLVIDNPPIVHWDERIAKYVIFVRALEQASENQRRIGRIETDDVLNPWPYSASAPDNRHLITPRHIPVVLQADEQDDPFSDIYYNSSFIYPWAQDVYLMFTAQFRHFSPQRQPFIRPRRPGQWEDFGLLEVQLAVSRDGIRWERPSREAYFPTGLADEWDRWYAVMAPGIIRRGNYLYQYYYSTGRTHDSVIVRPEYDNSAPRMGGIGVVRQRLDGFVSADADHRGGWLETPILSFSGRRLRLNVDTGAMGTAFVELRDADGTPIPGFTLEDCEEGGGKYIDQTVYWNGNTDVSSLAGKPVRIFFRLTRARLFAFQFTAE